MSGALRSGQRVHITDTGAVAVIWDAAPGPGRYWAHLLTDPRQMVLVKVVHYAADALPTVHIEEDWP